MARWQRHPFRGTLRSIQWCPWLSSHGAQVDVQESLPRQWSQARQRGKQVTKGRPLNPHTTRNGQAWVLFTRTPKTLPRAWLYLMA